MENHSQANVNDIDNLIEQEYKSLKVCELNSQKASHLNNIIQLKNNCTIKSRSNISIDIKQFIKLYILSAEERASGYDDIVFSKIENIVLVADIRSEISIYEYACKLLKASGHEDQHGQCLEKLTKLKKKISD
ncbi:hypothetical protein [Hymenobacter algoricola]|uniref:Uncharacterized protein n=1 Tax=Hymenobacter algoricola TaxID=486267 RepID=A0ABP7NXG1_9BACT